MAKDPVTGPVSPMEDPRATPPQHPFPDVFGEGTPSDVEKLPEEVLPETEEIRDGKQIELEEILPEAEEVQEGDKEVHEEIAALEADSAEELVAGLAEVEKTPESDEASGADVQLEAEAQQTYEYELRTELAMRPLDDVMFMAQQRGLGPVTGLPKEKIARMILRHEGFAAPELVELEPEEPNLPRYSVRVRRAIESQ